MKKITEEFFYPFTPGHMSMVHTIGLRMQEFNLKADDLVEMVEEKIDDFKLFAAAEKERMRPKPRQINPIKVRSSGICPDCGSGLSIAVVNSVPGDQIGGDATRMFVCQNAACAYTKVIDGAK